MKQTEHSIADIIEYVDDVLCRPVEIWQLLPPFDERLEAAIEVAADHFNVEVCEIDSDVRNWFK